jgi:hypothetical protein
MKKIYIVTEMLDYGLYDMANAQAFENELDAVLAAELGGLDIVTLNVIEPQKYGSDRSSIRTN